MTRIGTIGAAMLALALGAGGAWAASGSEIAFWRKADASNLAADYQDYLRRFPGGDFAPFARSRLGAADGRAPAPAAPLEAAGDPAAAETALGLGPAERMATQDGLIARGYDPGPVNGAFGEATRTALRAWQIRSGERATGFLTARQYDELTTAPLSGAMPADQPMTHRLGVAGEGASASREAALGYGQGELAEIEARLARAGFDPGPAEGELDPAARAAIRAYRQSRAFDPGEWLDRPVVDQLFRDTANWPGPRAATR